MSWMSARRWDESTWFGSTLIVIAKKMAGGRSTQKNDWRMGVGRVFHSPSQPHLPPKLRFNKHPPVSYFPPFRCEAAWRISVERQLPGSTPG